MRKLAGLFQMQIGSLFAPVQLADPEQFIQHLQIAYQAGAVESSLFRALLARMYPQVNACGKYPVTFPE